MKRSSASPAYASHAYEFAAYAPPPPSDGRALGRGHPGKQRGNEQFARKQLYGLLLSLLFIAVASAQVPEPDGFWHGPINSPVPATISGGKVIHTHALAKLLEEATPIVIDVSNTPKRPEGMALDSPWLPLPQDTIPGSIWIPDVGMADVPAQLDDFFREELSEATDGHLDAIVVIYCHEQCWLSWNAAKRAISYGYRNVHWYPEGIEGWRAAGLTTETVEPRFPPEI